MEVPPTASTTGYTSYPSSRASNTGNNKQASVQSAAIINFLRLVAFTASRNSVSSQALIVVLSYDGRSFTSCATWGMVDFKPAAFTFTVETTMGILNTLASFIRATTFLTRVYLSIDSMDPTWVGW